MAIVVNDLFFAYNDKKILKGCTFSIEKGKIYSLLGGNGSGKTTLIKIISGICQAQRGQVKVDGEDIRYFDVKKLARKIASVPQEHNGAFPYSVLEMVVMGRNPYLGIFERPSKSDNNISEEALELVGIYHLKNKNYMELSGGEKQLVFIARAIVQDASYLLLDEPTSNLDFGNQYKILEIITRIVDKKKVGAVISLHDPNMALSFSDYGIMLNNGRIMVEGAINNIMTKSNLESLYNTKINVNYFENGKKHISITQNAKQDSRLIG